MLARIIFLFVLIFLSEAVDILDVLANYPELKRCTPTFKMFDASGKLPNGIVSGNFIDLGNFDQCLQIDEINNKSEIIKGKYCVMKLTVSISLFKMFGYNFSELPEPDQEIQKHKRRIIIQDSSTGIILGWCIPHTCPIDEFSLFLTRVLQAVDPELQIVPVRGGLCQTKDDLHNHYNAANVIVIIFLVLTLLIIIISTLYDMYIQYYKKKPVHLILLAFSVKTNGQKLLNYNDNPDQLACLNGIRFLGMMWIVYAHRLQTSLMEPIANVNAIKDWINNPINMYIMNAPVNVDTFLVLSGLLVGYGYCLAKNNGVEFNFILSYLHRYIRLTPILAILVWIHATIIDFFGSGPFWFFASGTLKTYCMDYWWTPLLYIQNYYNTPGMCIGQAWYLSIDMQLYILSPIILIPLWKWPKRTLLVAAILVLASMASSFIATYYNNLKASYNTDVVNNPKFMQRYYITTHTRYGPWLMGLMLGYYLFKLKTNGANGISLNPALIVFGWIVGLGLLLSTLFAGHNLTINSNKLDNSFFNGFHRHGWALGLCWVIYACTQGYGGPINTLLSWFPFQILGRFTYTIYLVHLSLQYLIIGASRTSSFYSDFHTMQAFWGDFIISLIISVCLTLAYELPIVTIEKMVFKTGHKTKIPKLPRQSSSLDIGILFSDLESSIQ